MDKVGVVYKDSVLGKKVWIQFTVETEYGAKEQFYEGVIRGYQALMPGDYGDDVQRPVSHQHYVIYEDGEKHWHDLTEVEMQEQLLWKKPGRRVQPASSVSSFCCEGEDTTSEGTLAPAMSPSLLPNGGVVVTPGAGRDHIPPSPVGSSTVDSRKANRSKKRKKGLPELEPKKKPHQDISSNMIQINDLEHWLKNICKVSDTNVDNVLSRTRLLMSGEGIGYIHWPEGVVFHEGQTIDLETDFGALLMDAKAFEDRYGQDKGHGWVMCHAIKKLLLYKEYTQRRDERDDTITVHD